MMYLLFMIFIASLATALIFLFRNILKPFILGFNARFAIIVFFVGLIFSCLIFGFVAKQNTSLAENRNLEKWKPLKETSFVNIPRQIDAYVNDHFGFRDQFITIYRYFQLNIFGQSLSERVVKGRNGWLFYDKSIKVCYVDKPLSKDEIENTQLIEQLKKLEIYLNNRGIKLIILVMPSKPFVCTEYLPLWVNTDNNSRKTIDDFTELINTKTNIPLLDLFDSIMEAKHTDSNNFYYKNDTHWNTVGSYYAWKSTLRFFDDLGVSYNPIDFNDYVIKEDPFNGDLCRMLGNTIIDNSMGYFLKPNRVKKRIFLTKETGEKLNLKTGENLIRELSVSFKNVNTSKTTIPIIIADSYFLGSAFTKNIPFDKYYSMRYFEIAEGLPFLLQNQNDRDVVILSFVDRSFSDFSKSIMRWNSSKESEYNGYGWEQKLAY
ncbi:MAG TPA: hypothetical protein VJY41_01575 [Prolixibacteraceae bacterium]|nr:hypothetical protein [Prolixibacteraceae bacterium]